MTGVVITVDSAAVREAFARASGIAADPAPMLREIGAQLLTNTQQRFEAGAGPGGAVWKPSLRAQATGGKTLLDTGRLRSSISAQVDGNTLTLGTSVIYAAIQQFGGTIRAKTGKGLAFNLPWLKSKTDTGRRIVQSVTLPARPFLGFDATDERETLDVVNDHVRRALAA